MHRTLHTTAAIRSARWSLRSLGLRQIFSSAIAAVKTSGTPKRYAKCLGGEDRKNTVRYEKRYFYEKIKNLPVKNAQRPCWAEEKIEEMN